ncbi:MAG TPA: hypothetical protein VGB73_05125 [Pyrinomonadaceae bacterium]
MTAELLSRRLPSRSPVVHHSSPMLVYSLPSIVHRLSSIVRP